MCKELEQADQNAKINAFRSYIKNLLKRVEEQVDKMEADSEVVYCDHPHQELIHLSGALAAIKIIEQFISNFLTNME